MEAAPIIMVSLVKLLVLLHIKRGQMAAAAADSLLLALSGRPGLRIHAAIEVRHVRGRDEFQSVPNAARYDNGAASLE